MKVLSEEACIAVINHIQSNSLHGGLITTEFILKIILQIDHRGIVNTIKRKCLELFHSATKSVVSNDSRTVQILNGTQLDPLKIYSKAGLIDTHNKCYNKYKHNYTDSKKYGFRRPFYFERIYPEIYKEVDYNFIASLQSYNFILEKANKQQIIEWLLKKALPTSNDQLAGQLDKVQDTCDRVAETLTKQNIGEQGKKSVLIDGLKIGNYKQQITQKAGPTKGEITMKNVEAEHMDQDMTQE